MTMKGSGLYKIAWRNLWRNRRRTIITLSSISFGLLLAILFTGLGDSTYGKMIDQAAKMGGGHVTLQHPEYLEIPSLKRTVVDTNYKRQIVLNDENVERAVFRITGHSMLSTAANSLGAIVMAFDPSVEDKTTLAIMDSVVEGEMFQSGKGKGIILGELLAKNLDVRIGRKVVYTMTDKKGEIVTGLGRVSGIIRTGAPMIDNGLCLLPIGTLREVLGYASDEATQVAVFIDDQRKSAQVAKRLTSLIRDNTVVLPWKETQPDLASFIAMKVGGAIFFEILIMVLVAAGIFNTLFVSVMERVREFGIMLAIGFSPGKLFGLVMWESLWLALCGLILGGVVTWWPYHYLNTVGLDLTEVYGKNNTEVAGVAFDPVMYVDIYAENALIIAGAVLFATLVSGLYPAWRAGRVVPVESIKLV
jgi:ABC-type lipoprotein release transport system permease subunit